MRHKIIRLSRRYPLLSEQKKGDPGESPGLAYCAEKLGKFLGINAKSFRYAPSFVIGNRAAGSQPAVAYCAEKLGKFLGINAKSFRYAPNFTVGNRAAAREAAVAYCAETLGKFLGINAKSFRYAPSFVIGNVPAAATAAHTYSAETLGKFLGIPTLGGSSRCMIALNALELIETDYLPEHLTRGITIPNSICSIFRARKDTCGQSARSGLLC